ncbi:hypothetical protein TNCV_2653951 [Trichonephila clavipes]|nr:hypothetical protein TNCV_2653951 [Trichonephila clavipes]
MEDRRKRKCFPLSEKFYIVRGFENNVASQNSLAERLKISRLSTITKQRAKIEKVPAKGGKISSKIRKSLKALSVLGMNPHHSCQERNSSH